MAYLCSMQIDRKIHYQIISSFAALFCLAYVASLFLTYSFIVMPGLAGLSDTAFVAAFQGLETRFQNATKLPGYKAFAYGNIPALIAFPGAILFTSVAAILHWKTTYFKWILAALILFLAGMISTLVSNLPANEFIFTAGDPELIDVEQVRRTFNEKQWLYANHFRSFTSTIASLFVSWTLYLRITSNYKTN